MIQTGWSLENFLINCSFVFLLITMVSYWLYFFSFLENFFLKIGEFSNLFANFSILASLLLRWSISGHLPLSNCASSNNLKF